MLEQGARGRLSMDRVGRIGDYLKEMAIPAIWGTYQKEVSSTSRENLRKLGNQVSDTDWKHVEDL